MTASLRATLISMWLLGIGLFAVHLEIENVRSGKRLRELLIEREARLESFRRLEMRFNRMVSPDLLERALPEEFRPATEGSESDEGVETRA